MCTSANGIFCDNAIISQLRMKIVGQDNVCVDTLWLQIGVYWLICCV